MSSTVAALKAAATGAASPAEARSPYEGLKRQLEASRGDFLPLLGNVPANVDKFYRVVLNAVIATPDLLGVDRRSLLMSCSRAAQDGLLPDGREAVLNIYNTKVNKRGEPDQWVKKAQYLPMVGGLIKKLYESGEVTYVDAACVYKDDVFRYTRGDDPKIVHEPRGEGEFADIVAAYCIVKLKNGETKREVMFRRDIERVRGASKSADKGPWVDWYDQQAIKSVIKRIYKQLPRADAFESVAQSDNMASGYSGLGSLAGADIVPRVEAPTAPAPAALGHSDPDTIDMPSGAMAGEAIPAGGADPETGEVSPPAQAAPPPASAPAKPKQGKTPTFDYLAAAKRIESATDREVLALYIDELSSTLPDSPEKDALMAAYRTRDAALAEQA